MRSNFTYMDKNLQMQFAAQSKINKIAALEQRLSDCANDGMKRPRTILFDYL